MKHAVFAVLIAILSVGAPAVAGAQEKGNKIGYVDFQRIINDSKRGKDAKELLTKEGEFKSKKLRESEESLKKKFQELDAQRSVLSPEAFAKRQEELLGERDKFSEMVQTFQLEIRRKEQELTQDILDDIQKIIGDLAQKEGFALVLEKTESGILYAPPKYNLTDRVLQLYDNQKTAAPKKK